DILGGFTIALMLKVLKAPSMSAPTLLLFTAFVYDVFFVFVTPYLTKSGESIMEAAATGAALTVKETIPMLFRIPSRSGEAMLGFGDVVLPGILVTFLKEADARLEEDSSCYEILGLGETRTQKSWWSRRWGYHLTAILGYALGLEVTFVAMMWSNKGQPALLYLVCKHFLVKFCPNSLFTNTKSDLGNCDLVHDDKLREEYQKSADKDQYRYEEDFFEYLTYLHNDLERKIRRGKERKDKEVDETLLNPRKDEKEEKIVMLEQKIKDTLAKVEEAGEEGRVDEAQVLTDQVEKMQQDLQHLKQNDDVNPIFRQENKMEVCHVCGAFLVMNDTSN
ncbi:Luc7-like protein 3, partial [Podila epicladia]